MNRRVAVIFAAVLTIFVLALIAGAGNNGPSQVWSTSPFFGTPWPPPAPDDGGGNIIAGTPWPPPAPDDGGGNIIAGTPWPPPAPDDGGGNIIAGTPWPPPAPDDGGGNTRVV